LPTLLTGLMMIHIPSSSFFSEKDPGESFDTVARAG
jgi:hypothetical protein